MDSDSSDKSSQGPGFSQARTDEMASRFEDKKPKSQFPLPVKLLFGAIIIAFAVIGLHSSSLWQNDDASKASSGGMDSSEIENRRTVEPFELTDESGAKSSITAYKGKVVLLTFWASWCEPCLIELPSFGQLEKRLDNRDFVILPVNVDEGDAGKAFAKNFWSKNTFGFKSFFDPNKELVDKFEVDTLPATFVLDRQGRIVLNTDGANDWTDPNTVDLIQSLLSEKPN